MSAWSVLLDHISTLKDYAHNQTPLANNLILWLEYVKPVTQDTNYYQTIHVPNQPQLQIPTHFVLAGTILEMYVYLAQKDHFSMELVSVKHLILFVKLQIKWMVIVQVVMMVMVLISMENVHLKKTMVSVTHYVPNLRTTFAQNAHQVHTSIKTTPVNQSIPHALNLTLCPKHAFNATQVMLLNKENVKSIAHLHLMILIVPIFQAEFVLNAHLDIILKMMENAQLLTHYVQLLMKWMENVWAVLLDTVYILVFAYLLKRPLKIKIAPLLILIKPANSVQKDFSLIYYQNLVNLPILYAKHMIHQMELVFSVTVDTLLVIHNVLLI